MSGCKDKHNFSIQQEFYRKYDNHKHDNRKSKKGTLSTHKEPTFDFRILNIISLIKDVHTVLTHRANRVTVVDGEIFSKENNIGIGNESLVIIYIQTICAGHIDVAQIKRR